MRRVGVLVASVFLCFAAMAEDSGRFAGDFVVPDDVKMYTPAEVDAVLEHFGLAEEKSDTPWVKANWGYPYFRPLPTPRFFGVTCFVTNGHFTFWGRGPDAYWAGDNAYRACSLNTPYGGPCWPVGNHTPWGVQNCFVNY